MRVILFSMPDVVPELFSVKWRCPSMGLTALAGNVTDHEVFVGDLITRRKNVRRSIIDAVREVKPRVVGITSLSFQFQTARQVALLVKEVDPDIKTVLGGYHATLMFDEMSPEDAEPFDFLARGEGDELLNELLQALDGKFRLEEVGGLSHRVDGRFVHNPARPLADLARLRVPVRTNRLWTNYNYYDKRLDVAETSRGCTLSCNFCSIKRMYGKSFRVYEIERVIEDLKRIAQSGGNYVLFADDNITLDTGRFGRICDAIAEARLSEKMRFVTQAHSAGISRDPELARKMARAGFDIVFLGIENVSKRNLKLMKKGDIVEHSKRAIEYLHANDIMIIGGMIIGHAEDTEQDIRENFEFFRENDVDFIGDQVMTPYPKTEIRKDLLDAELVTNVDNYATYNGYWANVRTRHMSARRLQFLKWKYDRQYSKFFHPSAVFKRRYPAAHVYRRLVQIPYRRAKRFLRSLGKSEQDQFADDMRRHIAMNDFFDLKPKLPFDLPESAP